MSFVPPDGRFTLLNYRYLTSSSAISKDLVPLPISVRAALDTSSSPAAVDATLTSRLSTHSLEKVTIEMHLGMEASNVNCTIARGSGSGSGFGSLSEGVGWVFDPKRGVVRWEITSVPPSSSWTMKGTFIP